MLSDNQSNQRFREEIAEIIRRQVEFPRDIFVTVVDARLSEDQANAKIVLSVMPVTGEEGALEAVRSYHHEIVKEMAQTMRLRKVPNLHWEFDRTEQKAEDLEELIDDLKEQGQI